MRRSRSRELRLNLSVIISFTSHRVLYFLFWFPKVEALEGVAAVLTRLRALICVDAKSNRVNCQLYLLFASTFQSYRKLTIATLKRHTRFVEEWRCKFGERKLQGGMSQRGK